MLPGRGPSSAGRSLRRGARQVAALGAAPVLRRGAEIVAAVLAEAGAIPTILTAGAADRAKPHRGERGEDQGEEPLGGDIYVGAVRV